MFINWKFVVPSLFKGYDSWLTPIKKYFILIKYSLVCILIYYNIVFSLYENMQYSLELHNY